MSGIMADPSPLTAVSPRAGPRKRSRSTRVYFHPIFQFHSLVLSHRHIQKQELILTNNCNRCDCGPMSERRAGGSNVRAQTQLKLQTTGLKRSSQPAEELQNDGESFGLVPADVGECRRGCGARVVRGTNCDNRQTCSLVPWQHAGRKYGSK